MSLFFVLPPCETQNRSKFQNVNKDKKKPRPAGGKGGSGAGGAKTVAPSRKGVHVGGARKVNIATPAQAAASKKKRNGGGGGAGGGIPQQQPRFVQQQQQQLQQPVIRYVMQQPPMPVMIHQRMGVQQGGINKRGGPMPVQFAGALRVR